MDSDELADIYILLDKSFVLQNVGLLSSITTLS